MLSLSSNGVFSNLSKMAQACSKLSDVDLDMKLEKSLLISEDFQS